MVKQGQFDKVSRKQHYFNALNVYSKLCKFMPHRAAMMISRVYETLIHGLLYGSNNNT